MATKKCLPCEGGTPPLTSTEAQTLLRQVPEWKLVDNRLERTFVFSSFSQNVQFLVKVSAVAEAEGHHPDVHIHGVRRQRLSLWTHAIGGLSENDFILAAKIDRLGT